MCGLQSTMCTGLLQQLHATAANTEPCSSCSAHTAMQEQTRITTACLPSAMHRSQHCCATDVATWQGRQRPSNSTAQTRPSTTCNNHTDLSTVTSRSPTGLSLFMHSSCSSRTCGSCSTAPPGAASAESFSSTDFASSCKLMLTARHSPIM